MANWRCLCRGQTETLRSTRSDGRAGTDSGHMPEPGLNHTHRAWHSSRYGSSHQHQKAA